MKNALAQHVGLRIKALREQKGLTQAQLASLTLKSVESISNIERATVVPGLATIETMAQKLGCSVSQFFDGAPINEPTEQRSDAALAVLNALELLPDEDIELLAGMADMLEKRRK